MKKTLLTVFAAVTLITVPVLAEEALPTTISEDESKQLIEDRQKQIKRNTQRSISRQAASGVRNNPCVGMHGAMLRRCMQKSAGGSSVKESRRVAMQKRLARSSYGRRMASLRARQQRQRSNTDSLITPGVATDLRERTLYQGRLLRYHARSSTYAKTTSGPLLRARTSAGMRGENLLLPVCSRRDGIRLITCLRDMGVEISPRTVDKDTWAIYQRLYIR